MNRFREVAAGPYGAIEQIMAEFFPSFGGGSSGSSSCDLIRGYTNSDIQKISALLEDMGRDWPTTAPRRFHCEGIIDIWLPFSASTLPELLSPSSQADFLKIQSVALTKSIDLEKGKRGRHMHFAEGEPLPFKVIGILGKGGYGQVDKVLSLISFNVFALERIRRSKILGKAKKLTKTYEDELEVLKRLKHRHIVELVGSYTDHLYLGLVMSPVADSDMSQFLSVHPMSSDTKSLLRSFFGCLSTALAYLHDSKIRHKDIKPKNILVRDDTVLLTGFGLSLDWTDLSRSTTEGATAKTPKYCAPEVALYESRSSSSDIWSLACVFLEMVAVLKGETIEAMNKFFVDNGSNSPLYHSNEDAISDWIILLQRTESELDNMPLGWIKAMLRRDRKQRLGARELVSTITARRSFDDSHKNFVGLCCMGDDARDVTNFEGDTFMADAYDIPLKGKAAFPAMAMPDASFHAPSTQSYVIPYAGSATASITPSNAPSSMPPNTLSITRSRAASRAISRGVPYTLSTTPSTKSFRASRGSSSQPRKSKAQSRAKIAANGGKRSHEPTIFSAVDSGNIEQVQLILSEGVDLGTQRKHVSTALHLAASRGQEEMVRLLLGTGIEADPRIAMDGRHYYAQQGKGMKELSNFS